MEREAAEHDLNYVPRRGHRLHGPWRRSCNGDDGSDQAARRRTANFLRSSVVGRRRSGSPPPFKLILSNRR